MKKLKTIVVEDERLPRLSLLAKLEDYRQVLEVVDSCDSYESACESILRNRPDLLFLDIQLHGRDSLQLLDRLGRNIPLPLVIFTTAYSDRKYLMGAIKVTAVDYLMKPIGKEELAVAIAKALERASAGNGACEKLRFKSGDSTLFVQAEDIAAFKAEGNYARLITFGREEMILESLLSLEQRLDKDRFVRADRSTIVNREKVFRLNPKDHSCTLQGSDGRECVIQLSLNGIEKLSQNLYQS